MADQPLNQFNNFGIPSVAEPDPNEIKYLFKKVDRKLKLSPSSDSEIIGLPNYALQDPDNIPLLFYGMSDNFNALGGVTGGALAAHFQTMDERIGERRLRYARTREALKHPEITGVLNIYADEATTEDQHGEIIHVNHPDEEVVAVIESMLARIGLHDKSWYIIRNMCGYGDDFYEVVVNKSLTKILKLIQLPRDYVERQEKNGDLVGFSVTDIEMKDQNSLQYYSYSVNYQSEYEKENKLFYPFRILHFRIPSSQYGIYGESVVDSVLSSIEMLSMLEKSLLIARITRAPERRIFNIDVGMLQGDAAIKYARQVVDGFKNKKKLDLITNRKVDYQRDVFGVTEDIIIPKRAGTEGHSITTLDQLNNPGDVADLEFIRDKIFPGVGVPRQYLYDDQFTNSNTNLSSKSKPFAKKSCRVQRCFMYQLYKLAYIELRLNGYSHKTFDDLVITMNNPSNIDERERMEIETAKWTLIGAMKAMNAENVFVPDYKIYQEVLKLNDDDIVEWMKLCQLQQMGKNIFMAMPEGERPEGSNDLAENLPPVGGGGESAAPGGGGASAPVGGTTGGEAPGAPGGEEETAAAQPEGTPVGEKEGAKPIPPEVANKLGPPPKKAETAEYTSDIPKGTRQISEAQERKMEFLRVWNETFIEQIEKMTSDKQENEELKRRMRRVSKLYKPQEELYENNEFEGMKEMKYFKDEVEVRTYDEEEEN